MAAMPLIKCPKLEGMTLVEESKSPEFKTISSGPALPKGTEIKTTEYYRKALRTLLEDGYKLVRGGAYLNFSPFFSNSHWGYNLGKVVKKYVCDENNLSLLTKLAGNRLLNCEKGREAEYNSPFIDNFLMEEFYRYYQALLVDASYKDEKEREFLIDGMTVYLCGSDKSIYFYLQDWVSGCMYVSSKYSIFDKDSKAVAMAGRIFSSIREYLNKTDFSKITESLSVKTTPFDLSNLQTFMALASPPDVKNDWDRFIKDFGRVKIVTEPFVNTDTEQLFMFQVGKWERFGYFSADTNQKTFEVNETILKRTNYSPIVVKGKLPRIFLTFDPAKIPNGISNIPFKDKYNNLIIINVQEGKLEIRPAPPLSKPDNQAEKYRQVDIDLSSIGLGEYKNILHLAVFPIRWAMDNNIPVYSDSYSAEEVPGIIKNNINLGIKSAQELYGQSGVIQNVLFLKYFLRDNACLMKLYPDTLFLQGDSLLETELGWIASFHETAHSICQRFDLDKDPAIVEVFNKYTNKKFITAIQETEWFEKNTGEGHPWYNVDEFVVSLTASIMHPKLKDKIDKLSDEDREIYKSFLLALAVAVKRWVPKGEETPIYKKIMNDSYSR